MIECRPEPLRQALPDLKDLLPLQWKETGDLPLDPNWKLYSVMESTGHGVLFMTRRDGEPIGYAVGFLHPNINSQQTMVGTIPTYFVEPGPLRALILRGLLWKVRDWLSQMGAKQITVETEYQHSAGRLFERMGCIPIKIGYKMPLEERCQTSELVRH